MLLSIFIFYSVYLPGTVSTDTCNNIIKKKERERERN